MTTDRNRWLALAVLNAGFLMIILDTTIVSVAMPAILADLGFSQASLAWVVNAYLVPFGGLLLLFGRLGDLTGRRRMFIAGLGVFTVASLLGGLAHSPEALIAARALQGAGGAMTAAVILGMIVALFPQPREQAKAIATYSFVGAAGASLGSVLGGILTDTLGWHWIFFVNVPIGVAAVVAALRVVERDAGLGLARGADAPGAVLVTAALMLAVLAIVEAPPLGIAAAVLLAAFALRESRTPTPLVPLRLLRSRALAGGNAVMAATIAAMFGQQFVLVLYLKDGLGLGPIGIGLALLPIPLTIAIVSLGLAARAIVRFGARAVLLGGLAPIVAGLLLIASAPSGGAYAGDVLPALLLMGVGAGLALPAVTTLAMGGAAPADAGLASGLANTTQQVGAALGVAILLPLADHGTAFGVAAAIAVGAALLAIVVLRKEHVSVPAEWGTQEGGRKFAGTERGTKRAKEGPRGALFSRS